jgi:electron transfer flavoprotein beta subunit
MKIIVTLKQVAGRDSAFHVRTDGHWIEEADLDFEVNEPDAYALEAALQLKESEGGEVVVLCAGPSRVSKAIREALAKGADRAIHIELEEPERLDTLATANLLAKAVEGERPDLILTGLQSDDLGSGQTGVVLAELLGFPHASIIMEITKSDAGLRVRRELEGGWFQHLELPLPAVLTIQSGISKLRYATLMGIKRARSKEVRQIVAADLGVDLAPAASIERLHRPEKSKQTQLIDGTPAEAATKLVEKLRFEARAL